MASTESVSHGNSDHKSASPEFHWFVFGVALLVLGTLGIPYYIRWTRYREEREKVQFFQESIRDRFPHTMIRSSTEPQAFICGTVENEQEREELLRLTVEAFGVERAERIFAVCVGEAAGRETD